VSGQAIDELGLTSDEEPPGPDNPRPRRVLRRVLIAVAIVLGLALASFVGFVGFLGYTVTDNVTQEDLLPDPDVAITAPDGTVIPPAAEGVEGVAGTGTNFLLIGTDGRTATDRGRSDVIILVHVPADPTSVQMIHFPRDLFVSIPGHGKNKINAAYAFGGEPLLVQTLQNLLGVRIDHVARTDFDGFENMVDAVGGVRVYAEEGNDASGNGGVAISKGWNELDGSQALGFVRERYELSLGDISRGRRQLALVKALLLEATSKQTLTNPVKIARFTDAATKNLTVDQNLSLADLKDYALELRGLRGGDIVFATAPYTGFGTDPVAGSIDIVDEPRMELLGEALRTDTMDEYLDVFVTP
jgi:LCP family protein required for cell wall assembly